MLEMPTAFDEMADAYDREFTASAVGTALRAMTWARFESGFAHRESLLELGCGTGEDAVHLAKLGHRVLASDASAAMLQVAQRKAERAGVAHRIRFVHAPMEQVGAALAGESFDGAYSNFGALNCVPDVPALSRSLARLLKPAAPLMLVVMGRHVPWEWAWYLARGDRRRAFRRLDAQGAQWRGMTIRYPTPRELTRAIAPQFRARAHAPLGCVLPPSYAARWLERAPRTLAALAGLERVLPAFMARCADHYLLAAVRA